MGCLFFFPPAVGTTVPGGIFGTSGASLQTGFCFAVVLGLEGTHRDVTGDAEMFTKMLSRMKCDSPQQRSV